MITLVCHVYICGKKKKVREAEGVRHDNTLLAQPAHQAGVPKEKLSLIKKMETNLLFLHNVYHLLAVLLQVPLS